MFKYWPQADPAWQISRAYTVQARERLEQMLADLEEAAENKEKFKARAANYRRQYANEYRNAWWRMAADFNKGPATLATDVQWRNMAAAMTGLDNPYFQFIKDMAENLQAVSEMAEQKPIDLLPAVFTALMRESQAYSHDLTLGQRLQELVKDASVPKLEDKAAAALLDGSAAARAKNEEISAKLLDDYIKSLAAIYEAGNYEAKAMQLAQDGYEDAGKDSMVTASLTAAWALAAKLDHNFAQHQFFWDLVNSPAAFLTYTAVYRSACLLNSIWEDSVLSKAYQADPAKRWLTLFGNDGLVSKFVQGPLKPFLKSTISGWTAEKWLGISYPLRDEFIAFLNLGNANYHAPETEYKVTFTAYPIAVNPQAEKPYLARLSLNSDSGKQVLENYNYPVQQTFTWQPAESSKVRMEVFFSGASFSKEWFGPWAFRDFLQSFKDSTLTLTRKDFPDSDEIMDELDMDYIELRYDIAGGQPIEQLGDPPVIDNLPLTAAACHMRLSQTDESALPVIQIAPLSPAAGNEQRTAP
jgi:type VI secretion system protein ImpL